MFFLPSSRFLHTFAEVSDPTVSQTLTYVRVLLSLKNLFGFAVEGILVDSIDAIKKCTPNAQNGDHSGSQNGADAVKMEANLSTLLTSVLK